MAVKRMPTARKNAELDLVADFAESASFHGYKVTRHAVTHDHERDETRLSVSLVKSSGADKQTVLKMTKGGKNGEEDET